MDFNLENYKRRYYFLLTLVILVAGGVIGSFLYLVFPEAYFSWYPLIPAYFYILGLILIVVLDHCRHCTPLKILTRYMLLRVVKIMVTILVIVAYLVFVKRQEVSFVLTFMVFYFTYLVFETWIFYLFEKAIKACENRSHPQ